MPMYYDQELEKSALLFEQQKLEAIQRENELNRKHQERMLELKVEMAAKGKRATARLEALQRILMAVVKLPTIFVVLTLIGLLVLLKREVPAYLVDYLSL